MRSFLLTTFMGFLFFQLVAQDFPAFAERQLVVKFKDEIEVIRFESDVQLSYGQDILDDLKLWYPIKKIKSVTPKNVLKAFVIHFEKDEDIKHLQRTFLQSDLFEYVEPNYIGYHHGITASNESIPNDPFFNRQYALYNDGTFSLHPAIEDADIDMELAWDIEKGDKDIIVAFLDSGIKRTHPEFAGRVYTNSAELNDGLDNDNNGYNDDFYGWDFAYDDNSPNDVDGHGTAVTGIAVAKGDNFTGYAGVDWNCTIMPLKVLDDNGTGQYVWWAGAMAYAVDQGASVLNMSLGGNQFSELLESAAEYVHNNGAISVASMSNDNNNTLSYPAAIAQIIAVGSTDPDDHRSHPFVWGDSQTGSNFGNHIDVVAPGNYIYCLDNNDNDNYNYYYGGTSMATPLVTGLCALLLAQDPSRTPDEVREIIRETAEDQVGEAWEDIPGFDNFFGYGRINAYDALMFDQALSIKEHTGLKDQYSIYPNPASESIRIQFPKQAKQLRMVNSLGQIVANRSLKSSRQELFIDLNGFISGNYSISFYNKKGTLIKTKQLSIQ